MLPLSDPRWKDFDGGYRVKYDASGALSRLEHEAGGLEQVWSEFWENLHHQGDVGVASYAAVPHLARIVRERRLFAYEPFALAVTIELARGRGRNPELPEWLAESYHRALSELAEYGCSNLEREWDSATIKSVLALLAIVKGNRDLGKLIIEVDTGWEKDALDKFFQG